MASSDTHTGYQPVGMYLPPHSGKFRGRVSISIIPRMSIANDYSADTGAAGGYVPFIGIASFILWYRPIYLGLRKTEGKAMAFFFCMSRPP